MAGIYIHIPFCKQKCSYCNFHFSTRLKGKNEIQQALLKELDLRKEEINNQSIQTIYLGGGTPSLWTWQELVELFVKIESITGHQTMQEITIECNPDDLTTNYLEDLKKYTPVSRISIGIQSFHDDELKLMNRSHNSEEAKKSLDSIFQVGFTEVSADLIFGLPLSNMDLWGENLTSITQYPINHISCYNLTIEDKTVFKHKISKGKLTLPDDEETIRQFYLAKDILQDKGFLHYEISNYGKPDHLALHNTNYWKSVPYIGIGPSAHSYDGFRRRWNIADNQQYGKKIEAGDVFWESEELSETDLYNENIMTSLRTMWGIQDSIKNKFNDAILHEFYINIEKHITNKNIKEENGSYKLTSKGQAIADQIISDFFYV